MLNPETAMVAAAFGGIAADRIVTRFSGWMHRNEYKGETNLLTAIAAISIKDKRFERFRENMAETPNISERLTAAHFFHSKFLAAGMTGLAGLVAISLFNNLDLAQAATALSATYTIGGLLDAKRAGLKVIFNRLNR